MDMTILYKDKKVICDDEGITIKGYYQPVANDKKFFMATFVASNQNN
jgi:hypothetical protein